MEHEDALRHLPAVGKLLEDPAFSTAIDRLGRTLVADLLREAIDGARERLRAGGKGPASAGAAAWAGEVARAAEALLAPSPRTVINATGVIAHTNLGRSVLSPEAARRVAGVATGYVDLEYDLASGRRGDRHDHLAPLLARLFPGKASLAVNNNAAAIFLALRATSKGKEVVVSRGELVEIGGSFRVPDILAASGAKLREVGTTNRTRREDYEAAIGPKTGAVLKVHSSNFKIVGFTEEAPLAALAEVCRARGVPLIVDWGSGDLVDLAPFGVADEIPVRALLDAGADLVTFSGDKLLGGPQAGLVIGTAELVRRLKRDPLARVLRLDRLQIAALRETLASYVRGRAFEEIPTLRMLAASAEEIGRRAERLLDALRTRAPGLDASIIDGVSRPGGGSSPVGELPTKLVAVSDPSGDAARIERRLRRGDPPVIARVQDGLLLLDLRTVLPDQDAILAERLGTATVAPP
jgi:L-seryl-tRNA(Ser) seleniumtransferase